MRFLLFTSIVLLCATVTAHAGETDLGGPIPSYRQAVEAFQAERARTGESPIRTEDRQVMQLAAQELATALPEPGLAVGERAPDFALLNAVGNRVRLNDLLAQGPVVLTFYRGAWCPYCNLQLRGLHQTLPHIEREGAQLVTVSIGNINALFPRSFEYPPVVRRP